MAQDPIELQNKLVLDGQEYFFPKALSKPVSSTDPLSEMPVNSTYIYQLTKLLSGFIGKTVTGLIAQNNNNVVTSAAVYNALQGTVSTDNTTSHITQVYQQNVLFEFVDMTAEEQGLLHTYAMNSPGSTSGKIYMYEGDSSTLNATSTSGSTSEARYKAYFAKYRCLRGCTYLLRWFPFMLASNLSSGKDSPIINHGADKGEYWNKFHAFYVMSRGAKEYLMRRYVEPLHEKELYFIIKIKTNNSQEHTHTEKVYDSNTYYTYYDYDIVGFELAYWNKNEYISSNLTNGTIPNHTEDQFVTIFTMDTGGTIIPGQAAPTGCVPIYYNETDGTLRDQENNIIPIVGSGGGSFTYNSSNHSLICLAFRSTDTTGEGDEDDYNEDIEG